MMGVFRIVGWVVVKFDTLEKVAYFEKYEMAKAYARGGLFKVVALPRMSK